MTADIRTRNVASETANDVVDSISRTTITIMAAVSALIGTWASASVVGALAGNGPGALARGFGAALFG